MNRETKMKDVIAGEIYRLILCAEIKWPLEKYLVVEFGKDGNIEKISFDKERRRGDKILSIEVEGVSNGKEIYRKIREGLKNNELNIDMRIWNMIGNAYDWVWGVENEEQ